MSPSSTSASTTALKRERSISSLSGRLLGRTTETRDDLVIDTSTSTSTSTFAEAPAVFPSSPVHVHSAGSSWRLTADLAVPAPSPLSFTASLLHRTLHPISPRTNTHASILELPNEILLRLARHCDRRTLATLSTTNRRCAHLVRDVLYILPRYIAPSSLESALRLADTLESTPEIAVSVRGIRLSPMLETERCDPRLDQVIQRLSVAISASPQRRITGLDLGFCRGVRNYPLFKAISLLFNNDTSGPFCLADAVWMNLSGGSRNDILVAKIATRVSWRLYALSLAWNTSITDFSIFKLASSCPNLAYVSIACCNGVTNVGLLGLVGECRDLVWINAGFCQGLTMAGIKSVIAKWKRHDHRKKRWIGVMGIKASKADVVELERLCQGTGVQVCFNANRCENTMPDRASWE